MNSHQNLCRAGALCCFVIFCSNAYAQPPVLVLDVDKARLRVSPMLAGLMTEEINYSYDGGLYAELIRNRSFKDDPVKPVHWSILKEPGDSSGISLDANLPLNEAQSVSLRLDLAEDGRSVGVANEGFWGIPVKPSTTYHASFYAKTTAGNANPLRIGIVSTDGSITYAEATITGLGAGWKKFECTLSTGSGLAPTADARFVIRASSAGRYWFCLVSLFPPTYNNRPNGNRPDIMQLLANLKPAFLRLPGGNYLEGDYFSTRFPWAATLGPLEDRPGHMGPWTYRSSDGMGLLEFMEWCEDLHIEPVLGIFAGYTLKGDYVTGPFLQPYIDDALDELEYLLGDTTTKGGKLRTAAGHPKPFPLRYIEIGNEDYFGGLPTYPGRFRSFYDAIKTKYPGLLLISTVAGQTIGERTPDIVDEHFYRSAFEMESDAGHYDNYDRSGPKIFVGEWATMEGQPTPNFNAALGDAAWMTGMERNSDIVVMSSYAPLLVNVNPGAAQWSTNLIGYDALRSYGSPSYYAQQLFNVFRGAEIIPVTAYDMPTQVETLSATDAAAGKSPKTYPSLFCSATVDKKTALIYLKIINTKNIPQSVGIRLKGVSKVTSNGKIIQLAAKTPEETNSIANPDNIVPVTKQLAGVSSAFTHTVEPYSINVLVIAAK